MAFQTLHVPTIGAVRYHVTTLRRSFEHFAFIGLTSDFLAFMVGNHSWMILAFGKAAGAVGVLGAYMVHMEEEIKREGV